MLERGAASSPEAYAERSGKPEWTDSQYEHPKHPPDKEYRDNGTRDVNDPVASCFRFPKIEHAAMVAGLHAGWWVQNPLQPSVGQDADRCAAGRS